jgi:hypothetical protein
LELPASRTLATTTLLEVKANNMFKDCGFDQKSGSKKTFSVVLKVCKALHMTNKNVHFILIL